MLHFAECSVVTVFQELFDQLNKDAFKMIDEAEKIWNRINGADKMKKRYSTNSETVPG